EKTFYNMSKLYDSPWYAIDPSSKDGLSVILQGARKTNVLAIFRDSFQTRDPAQPSEQVLNLETVDLRGLFFHHYSVRTYDRAGNVLGEKGSLVPSLGQLTYSDTAILQAAERAPPTKQFSYHYDRGWFVEQADSQ